VRGELQSTKTANWESRNEILFEVPISRMHLETLAVDRTGPPLVGLAGARLPMNLRCIGPNRFRMGRFITLQFIDGLIRGLMFIVAGRRVWRPSSQPRTDPTHHLTDTTTSSTSFHYTAIANEVGNRGDGGGTGLSTLLRGIKEHTGNPGPRDCHRGRRRRVIIWPASQGLRYPAAGDFASAWSPWLIAEPLMTRLFQYRFTGRAMASKGHSFGNLFIAAMAARNNRQF